MNEKIIDVDNRIKLLNSEKIDLNSYLIKKNSLFNLNEFQPVKLVAHPIYNVESIKITKTVDSQPGYKIIHPYKLKDTNKIIFVDKGWYSNIENNKIIKPIDSNNNKTIKGIIYYGDTTKYTSNDINKKNFITTNIKDMSKCYDFENLICKEYMIKEVLFNEDNLKDNYPVKQTTNDLLFWTITPSKHRSYYRFWITITLFNILSNFYVWTVI